VQRGVLHLQGGLAAIAIKEDQIKFVVDGYTASLALSEIPEARALFRKLDEVAPLLADQNIPSTGEPV
jgi:hypothetical protein